jgi:myo-inositol-1(or 4)-monophosphatase
VFDEMFSAAAGLGATLNGEPIHVSSRTGLRESVVNVWLGDRSDMQAHERLGRVHRIALQQRVFGGTAIVMAYLAAGRYDLFYVADNGRMGAWDLGAGAILIEEAGGHVTTVDGAPFRLPSNQIACTADPATLEELQALLAE